MSKLFLTKRVDELTNFTDFGVEEKLSTNWRPTLTVVCALTAFCYDLNLCLEWTVHKYILHPRAHINWRKNYLLMASKKKSLYLLLMWKKNFIQQIESDIMCLGAWASLLCTWKNPAFSY